METLHGSPIVDKTAIILTTIAERGSISLSEIVAESSLARSTVYRILNSLLAHELVGRHDGDSNYQLGPKFVQLARKLSPNADRVTLIELARPWMEASALNLGETFKLSAPEGDSMMAIYGAQSPKDVALSVKPGALTPKHVGAAGKIVLAHSSAQVIDAYCARELEARTPYTITNPEVLRRNLQQARREGYAEDHQESGFGIGAIAVAIFDAAGRPMAALSVPHLTELSPERRFQIRNTVTEVAERITAALGGRAPKLVQYEDA